MKRTWTIIGVADVARSFRWYQALFGQAQTAPAHDYFGQIRDADGTVLLCLHQWGAHDHPTLASPDLAEPGNGLLLFFRVDDFDAALVRARALVARLEEEPHANPATGTREFALRDPDGYYVMVSALAGDERPPRDRVLRFPASVKRDPAIGAWMRAHPGALGAIARRWFEVMRACGDDVRELLHDGHPTACVGDAAFAYVNAFRAHVNVGFFRGAEIADHAGLLEGTGRFMRHVKLSPDRHVDAGALMNLIETAYIDMKGRLKPL